MFQTINDPKPVIANEAKRNEAIAEFEIASLRDATRTLHSVSLAMTIGHFFTWSTLNVETLHITSLQPIHVSSGCLESV